jgi:hypothetical protein
MTIRYEGISSSAEAVDVHGGHLEEDSNSSPQTCTVAAYLGPVGNIEANKAYQNSFFLHSDGPGWPWPGWAATSGSAAATRRNAVTMRVMIAISIVDWRMVC